MPYVYVITEKRDEKSWKEKLLEKGTLDVKIGGTNTTFAARFRRLQQNQRYELEKIAVIETTGDFRELEKYYHTLYHDKRVNREWYRLPKSDIERLIEDSTTKKEIGAVKRYQKKITTVQKMQELKRRLEEENTQLRKEIAEKMTKTKSTGLPGYVKDYGPRTWNDILGMGTNNISVNRSKHSDSLIKHL